MMMFTTLTESINAMNNYTLEHHYGVEANATSMAMMTSLINVAGGTGLVFAIFVVFPKFDSYGRKFVCVYLRFIFGFLSSLSQLTASVFQATEFYMIGNFMNGTQIIIRGFLTVLFICECSPDKNRGFASASLIFFDVIGQVIMYSTTSPSVLGGSTQWFIFPLICVACSIILFLTTAKLPESPKWLVKMNRIEEARQAILFYHGSCDTNDVLMTMIKEKNLTKEDKISLREILGNDTLREALKLILVVNAFTIFSPVIVEKLYTVQIHGSAGFEIDEVLNINLIVSILFIPTRFAGTFLIDYLGRRPALFIAAFLTYTKIWLMAVSLTLSYFDGFGWIARTIVILADVLTELAHGTGLAAIVPLLISELFPPSARTSVSQSILILNSMISTPAVFMFPFINTIFPPGCYLPYIFIQPIIIGYLYMYLPETKSRAVCDIIDSLDQEVSSRTNTLENEKLPLLRQNRAMSLFNKQENILSTYRERTFSLDLKSSHETWNTF